MNDNDILGRIVESPKNLFVKLDIDRDGLLSLRDIFANILPAYKHQYYLEKCSRNDFYLKRIKILLELNHYQDLKEYFGLRNSPGLCNIEQLELKEGLKKLGLQVRQVDRDYDNLCLEFTVEERTKKVIDIYEVVLILIIRWMNVLI